jgi:ferredoxin
MADVKNPNTPHSAVTASGWTVEVDAAVCIGASPCVGVAPKTFELNDEGKAVILRTIDEDDVENIINAARSCPVSAIKVMNPAGEVVFPE